MKAGYRWSYGALRGLFLGGLSVLLMGADASVTPPPTLPPGPSSTGYVVLPANDLGMHCDDSDFQIWSLLPPFNNLHAQVIQKGAEPFKNPKLLTDQDGVTVQYFASANPNDPIAHNSINTTARTIRRSARATSGTSTPAPATPTRPTTIRRCIRTRARAGTASCFISSRAI